VDAAQDGDTVLVGDGTFSGNGNRDIDFHGKNIIVQSVHGPTKTIIDCGGYKSTDDSGNHRGFYLHSGEKLATISGFTIKNGYAPLSPAENVPFKDGGGILCVSSSPAIDNCLIINNFADHVGGGICVNYGSATITNCTLRNNSASAGGGMLDFSGGSDISNCLFTNNSALNGPAGGLYDVFGSSSVMVALRDLLHAPSRVIQRSTGLVLQQTLIVFLFLSIAFCGGTGHQLRVLMKSLF
jgi:hypothetical protein